jgi:hypothetical protein
MSIAAQKVFDNDDLRKLIFSFHAEFPHETRIDRCLNNFNEKHKNCRDDCEYNCIKCILNTYCLFYLACCCNCNCIFFYNWFRNCRI